MVIQVCRVVRTGLVLRICDSQSSAGVGVFAGARAGLGLWQTEECPLQGRQLNISRTSSFSREAQTFHLSMKY